MEEKTYKDNKIINDKVLTVEELQQVLKIGRNTALKLVNNVENFPVLRIGTRILIPVKGLDAWLLSNTGKNIKI